MINQLFKKMIPNDTLLQILNCYNLKNLTDSKIFTRYDLILYDTISKLYEIRDILLNYYLPCKAYLYLDNITPKKCITILRQVIRLYNYKLKKCEKYIVKKKTLAYQMIPKDKDNAPSLINKTTTIITFD